MCPIPSLSEALVKDDFVTQRSFMSRAKGSIHSHFGTCRSLRAETTTGSKVAVEPVVVSALRTLGSGLLACYEHRFTQLATKVLCLYDFHCPRQFIKMSPSLICMRMKDAFVIVGVG